MRALAGIGRRVHTIRKIPAAPAFFEFSVTAAKADEGL
jgi:hypothetical protein